MTKFSLTKITLLFLILLSFITISSATKMFQNRNLQEIKLNETKRGEMKQDESFEYFTITMPNDIEDQKYLLIFTVKEDKENIEEGEEIFSDPDIYVSKTNPQPNSPESSTWYSERYGNDILSIPSEEVKKGEKFYIGMYCQFKCRYILFSYLSEEILIKIGVVNTVTLNANSSMHYYFNIPKDDIHEELNLVAFSFFFRPFKIFMSKNSPSSQNTYPIIPSWTGGYTISVSKQNNNYCTGCIYHFLIQSAENNTNIRFYAFFQDDITTINSNVPFFDSVRALSKRCYNISINDFKKKNQELIIQMTLFSGNGVLHLEGWIHDPNVRINNETKNIYSFEINGAKILLLNQKDFDYFDNKNPEFRNKDVYLNFCFFSKHMASFSLFSFFLNDAEKMQRYNFLMPGREITSYLKNGQYTKYRIMDFSTFSYKTKSNITISFTSLQGDPKMYGFFCIEERCHFNKEYFNNKKSQLIPSEITSYSTFEIKISGNENKCYEIYEENSKSEIRRRCGFFAVISCVTNNEFCKYKLRYSLNETALLMSPKTTYFSIIPVGKVDLYEIIITDPSYSSLVIVLNTASGDAELLVYKKKNETSGNDHNNLIGISLNNDYIPDVIRVTPKKLNSDNIIGKYIVKVTASSFSSYNLYYYTTYNKTENETINFNDVTMTLIDGQIISDYFPNNLNYKIYSYSPVYYSGKTREKIKIVLTRINVKFSFKVYLNLDTLSYNSNPSLPFEEKLTGYDWSSDANGELLISPDDEKYSDKGPYYIVVSKEQYITSEEIDKKAVMNYYLGVTSGDTPFLLFESIEHSMTLTDDYNQQLYFYSHGNIKEPFELNINCLSGAVHVFVDINKIDEDEIQNIIDDDYNGNYENNRKRKSKSSLRFELFVDDYVTINLDEIYFRKYLKNKNLNSVSINILIQKALSPDEISYDSQFIIVGKSSLKEGEILIPGIAKKDSVNENKYKYYIIEEVQKRKGCVLFVTFQSGYGEIYMRIPKDHEKELKFPNETFYDFKGNDSFIGKSIQIPANKFQELNSQKLILQILISIKGEKIIQDVNHKPIEYTISYSSEPKRINQNIPYYNYISVGEFQYFTFYFDKKATNIYISLSNMDGDADLFLNYGNEIFPTPDLSDWKSSNTGHEYIDFNIEDPFFKKNKIENLSGYYTLLVSGYSSTSYTLFISTHDEVVYPLLENNPVICQCEEKGEKCFFRYDKVYSKINSYLNIEENEIIFTSQFLYGDGELYGSIYKDQDLNEAGKKFYSLFPNENNAQFSNIYSNQYNYMKIKVDNEKYTEDSVILLTFICKEKTEVSINTASLSYDSHYDYMDLNRENIYYLKFNESLKIKEQPQSLLSHYKSQENDLLFDIKVYLGSARVNVFVNESYWDVKEHKIKYFYEAISDFIIDADSSSNTYHNYIKNSTSTNKKTIYFKVTPMSDVGFFIQLIYDKSFVKIPIGQKYKYQVSNNKMIGYFDLNDAYSNLEFSLSLNRQKGRKAKVYIRINIINKDYKTILNSPESSYHYQMPSKTSYDYKGETDDIINSLTINMDKLPKIEEKENVFIRALFLLELNYFGKMNSSYVEDNTVYILLSPNFNHFKRVKAEPFQYYFTNESFALHIPNKVDHMDYKIFALDKIDEDDDKMIIDISSCTGQFSFSLSDQIKYSGEQKSNIQYKDRKEKGRITIIIDDLKTKHLFLTIWPTNINNNNPNLSYLMYYYSTTKELYKSAFVEGNLQYKFKKNNRVAFIIPKIKTRDTQNNVREISDFRFSIFLTFDHSHFKNMESICYLTREFDNVDPLRFYRDVQMNKDNELVIQIQPGVEYYINILAQNIKTNEIITFKPISIMSPKTYNIPYGLILFLIAFIICVAIIYYCLKKKHIDYVSYDSETSQVKTASEMSQIRNTSGYVSPGTSSDTTL